MRINYDYKWILFKSKNDPTKIFLPGSILITKNPGNFVSEAICAFANVKGERGMASHIAVVIDKRDILEKKFPKLARKWRRKGYSINDKTVWIAESTFLFSRLAPIDIYFHGDIKTMIIDWAGLPPNSKSKTRQEISRRAISQINKIYPFWHFPIFILDKLTGWTGLHVGKILGKLPLRVCSRFAAHACNTESMRKRYGIQLGGKKEILLKKIKGKPGSLGIPIMESTPDDWYDSAFTCDWMFARLFSTY